MNKRVKVWLAYPAMIVLVLAVINFGLFFVNQKAPVSVFISHPLGMLAGGYLTVAFVLPAMFGRQGASRVLPPAGPVVATGRCGGRLGRMIVSGRLITVTVYPDRLTLKAFIMGEYTIHGSELGSVADEGSWRDQLVIEHTAPGQVSPVVLAAPSEELRQAISQIDRSPVAALAEPPAPESSEDKAARRIAWNVTSIMYVTGLALGIAFVGFAVIQMVHTPSVFSAIFAAVGLVSVYQFARQLIKHARSD